MYRPFRATAALASAALLAATLVQARPTAPSLSAASPASGALDIVLAAAGHSSTSGCEFTDVQSKLLATGHFGTVDIVDVINSTPTLSQLMSYNAVLVWSRLTFADPIAYGDVLADYVDAGGGVVLAEGTVSGTIAGYSLQGRWLSGGYGVVVAQSGWNTGAASLGTIAQPGHPIVAGVTSITGGNILRTSTTSLVQGSVVASWNDGSIAVAVGDVMPNRVDLGLYPPSSACLASYWNGDGDVLMANALVFAATGATIGTSYCTANANSSGGPASIAATGSTDVTANDLTLTATGLPANSFGYFLASRTQGLVMNPGGSQGNLCLGGSIGRFVQQIQNSGAAGEFAIAVDLTAVPHPSGAPVAVSAGESWNFTSWFRDANPAVTSNFSDAVEVTFQ